MWWSTPTVDAAVSILLIGSAWGGDEFPGRAFVGVGGATEVVAADLDLDGDVDVVALIVSESLPTPTLRTFLNDGSGALLAGASTAIEPFTNWLVSRTSTPTDDPMRSPRTARSFGFGLGSPTARSGRSPRRCPFPSGPA